MTFLLRKIFAARVRRDDPKFSPKIRLASIPALSHEPHLWLTEQVTEFKADSSPPLLPEMRDKLAAKAGRMWM